MLLGMTERSAHFRCVRFPLFSVSNRAVSCEGRMNRGNIFAELKRRNVYKVAIAYIVAGWALAQGIAQVFPVFDVPNWVVRLVVVLIIIGFPITLIFAWAFEITPEGIKSTEEADAMPPSSRPSNRTWIYIVVVGAAVSLSLFFLGRYTAENRTASSGDRKSIAVLPFTSLSENKSDAYFADGVQDQILTNLAKVSDLKVISHTSVRQYKTGAERNMREIGQQLGVAYIMEGSVRRDRDRLRINAQLIDARTDAHIWAETYDRTAADLFAIQSELAQSIVTQLKATLSPQQKAEIEERPTQDLDAFELYLQAKPSIDSYLNSTDVRAALLQALKSLDEAIQARPEVCLRLLLHRARKRSSVLFRSRSNSGADFSRRRCSQDSAPASPRFSRSAFRPRAITTSGVSATTIAPWKNWQSRGRVCRTARRSSFSPATSIAAATILPTPNAISPPRSRSIREIRMLTIFWPTPTCCNAGFLKRSTSMTTCLLPERTSQSSGSGAPRQLLRNRRLRTDARYSGEISRHGICRLPNAGPRLDGNARRQLRRSGTSPCRFASTRLSRHRP